MLYDMSQTYALAEALITDRVSPSCSILYKGLLLKRESFGTLPRLHACLLTRLHGIVAIRTARAYASVRATMGIAVVLVFVLTVIQHHLHVRV